jgi:tyrosyl-tRNA synthetase
LATDRTPQEIEALKKEVSSGKLHPMDAKMRLAEELVSDFQGAAAGREAAENFQRVFRDRQAPEQMREIRLSRAKDGLKVSIPDGANSWQTKLLAFGSNLVKWSAVLAWLEEASSVSDVERIMKQRGFEINGHIVVDPAIKLNADCPAKYELRLGKKKFLRVIVDSD